TECWIFEGGGRIGQFFGGYHDARGQLAQSLAQTQTVVKKTTEVAQPKAETFKRGGNKLSYNLQREQDQLPQKLEALEAKLQTLQ
ncbi:ABC transporter ATP-binding protein, partial [Klebsiella pneumoniae]|nr:ABC transporter ATP-binding protein [Klebsiella pneumoniae]